MHDGAEESFVESRQLYSDISQTSLSTETLSFDLNHVVLASFSDQIHVEHISKSPTNIVGRLVRYDNF